MSFSDVVHQWVEEEAEGGGGSSKIPISNKEGLHPSLLSLINVSTFSSLIREAVCDVTAVLIRSSAAHSLHPVYGEGSMEDPLGFLPPLTDVLEIVVGGHIVNAKSLPILANTGEEKMMSDSSPPTPSFHLPLHRFWAFFIRALLSTTTSSHILCTLLSTPQDMPLSISFQGGGGGDDDDDLTIPSHSWNDVSAVLYLHF